MQIEQKPSEKVPAEARHSGQVQSRQDLNDSIREDGPTFPSIDDRTPNPLAMRVLTAAAIRMVLIMLLITTLVYFIVARATRAHLINEHLSHLSGRGEREQILFRLAEDNLQILSESILRELQSLRTVDVSADLKRLIEPRTDGTFRSPPGLDLATQVQIFVARNSRLDPDDRRLLVASQRIVEKFGPAWSNRFPNTYFVAAADFDISFWKGTNFSEEVEADFSSLNELYFKIGTPQQNPLRENRWTPVYQDINVKKWMVSSITPLYQGDTFLGIIGHDIYLDKLIERTLNDYLPGTIHIMVSQKGELIAHPRYMSEITAHVNGFEILRDGDENLRVLYRLLSQSDDSKKGAPFILEDAQYQRYLIGMFLPETGWWLVTEYPFSRVTSAATQEARVVLLVGLLSLTLELLMLFMVLRRNVFHPIQMLQRATRHWASDETTAVLHQLVQRGDEIGKLAKDFLDLRGLLRQQMAAMHQEILQRRDVQKALEQAHDELEQRVQQATGELQEANQKLTQLALFDPLTGLPNRKHYEQILAQVLATATLDQRLCALMFVDLDGFKTINDNYGHDSGDHLLKEIAQRLRGVLRDQDVVARLGGDEFVILVRHISRQEDVEQLAQRLLKVCSAPVTLNDIVVKVSASVGIALAPIDLEDVPLHERQTRLQQYADLAMYDAKDKGKGAYSFFRPQLTHQLKQQLTIMQELQRAIDQEEFVVYLQPIHATATGKPVGLEALVRWQHPTRGLLTPNFFIQEAERSRLIPYIDLLVASQVCRLLQAQAFRWPKGLYVALNFSAVTFEQPETPRKLQALVQQYGVPPERLAIELTETCFIQEGAAINTVRALEQAGFRLFLDDFGTGYSSLSYLNRVRLSAMKLDRYFIKDLVQDPYSQAVVSTVCTLASKLSIGLVAEGVENEAQLQVLRAAGCAYVQGFLFSRPMEQTQALRFVLEEQGGSPSAELGL